MADRDRIAQTEARTTTPRRVLVTGAAGRLALAIVAACADAGLGVRALVPGLDGAERARAAGAHEIAQGQIDDEAALTRACLGMDAICHIAPPFDPDEVGIAARTIEAARAAGLRRFVYLSVLHPQAAAIPHHWRKMRVEDMLWSSGLDVSVLQPAPLMQSLLRDWRAIRETGLFPVPFPLATRLSLVDRADVATVAARVLAEDGHAGATYELVGTPPLGQLEVAFSLSKLLHRPVRALEQSRAEWEAAHPDLSPAQRDSLASAFAYYAAHGLAGNPNVLALLLGRPPTHLKACLEACLARRRETGARRDLNPA